MQKTHFFQSASVEVNSFSIKQKKPLFCQNNEDSEICIIAHE